MANKKTIHAIEYIPDEDNPSWVVYHDDKRNVTIWKYLEGGMTETICCLPDSALTPQIRALG